MERPTSPLIAAIRSFRFRPDQWLWCLQCHRFFQGRDARADVAGGMQGCAFPPCKGSGYDIDLFDWDAWPRGNPALRARWPSRLELRKGLVAEAWASDDAASSPGHGVPAWLDPDDDDDGASLGASLAPDEVDVDLRDALLEIERSDDPREYSYFTGLDLARLEELVRRGYVDLYAPRHGPFVHEFLAFMRAWPAARAHGWAPPAGAPAQRVVVEGVECELGLVPAHQRERLREEFLAAFGHAHDLVDQRGWLYACWIE